MRMRTRAEEYLAMRRSLGYKLHGEGRMLGEFADLMALAEIPQCRSAKFPAVETRAMLGR